MTVPMVVTWAGPVGATEVSPPEEFGEPAYVLDADPCSAGGLLALLVVVEAADVTGLAANVRITDTVVRVSDSAKLWYGCPISAVPMRLGIGSLQRDPETLELRGPGFAGMVFLAGPPLGGRLGEFEVEHVATLNFEPVRADVVLGLAGSHTPSGHLDAYLFVAVVGVPEHQQSAVADDVTQHVVLHDLLGHDVLSRQRDSRASVVGLFVEIARGGQRCEHSKGARQRWLVRCQEAGGVLGELADGWPSSVGGEVADELVEVADAAGGVDLPGEGLHRAGGQSDGVVDFGLVLAQVGGGQQDVAQRALAGAGGA
ncbi:MAG: hypothetical protein ACRDQZ_11040, partial [Mycobacteriales bacterium]